MDRSRLTSILIFLVLTSFVTVRAQTWTVSPTLDTIRAVCFSRLNVASSGTAILTTTRANYEINAAYAQTCLDYPAYEKLDTLTVSRAGEGAALPADFLRMKAVFKVIRDTQRIPVQYIDIENIKVEKPGESEYMHEVGNILSPNRCYTFADRLHFVPKDRKDAADADTMLIHYYAMGQKLTGTDTCRVLPEYLEKVMDYACWRMALVRNDFVKAQAFQASYQAGIQQPRKEREDEGKQ